MKQRISFNLIIFSITLLSLIFLASCAKEDPLTPNEELIGLQSPNFDGSLPGSGRGGSGSGGGNNGGGSSLAEYFEVMVDSVPNSYSNPVYQEALGMYQIINDNMTVAGQIQITLFNAPEDSTYANPFIGYFQSQTSSYQAINGQLDIDSVTATFIRGTFTADVVNNNTNDTIALTNGRFLVNR
jgi:hypothetical protein